MSDDTAPQEPGASDGSVDEDRRARVQRAVRIWTRQLIDLGARNNLLFYKDMKQGTISLEEATPPVVDELLARRKVRLARLFPDAVEAQARRARTIRKKAQELFEERGLEALYLACGLATWDTVGPTPAAPVLLAPIRLSPRGAAQEDFDLEISGELEVNPTLLHLLATEFAVRCSAEELLSHTEIEGAIDTPDELAAVYRWLEGHSSSVPGFSVSERLVLGTFAYAKLPMVNDLEASEDALVDHDLIAAIAGDPAAREAVRSRLSVVDATEPNRIPPADEFLILDADSSQNWAINACLGGQDVIVRGPPGTGKSQTIANLIATLVARDKRVLFVAEKRAAIDAVLSRLAGRDLSDLVLDLHGGSGSKKKLAQALAQTLNTHASLTLPRLEEQQADLTRRRDQLNRREEALHRLREPWLISVYELQADLMGLGDAADANVRFRGDVLAGLDRESYRAAREDLGEWAGLGAATLLSSGNPWASAEVVSADEAREALALMTRLRDHTLPTADRAMRAATEGVGYPWPDTVAGWRAYLDLSQRTVTLLASFSPSLFEADLPAIALALAPARQGFVSRLTAGLSAEYRRAKTHMRASLVPGVKLPTTDLLAACIEAQSLRDAWTGDGAPTPPDEVGRLSTAIAQLEEEIRQAGRILQRNDLTELPVERLMGLLAALVTEQPTLYRLPEIHRLRVALIGRGLEGFMTAMSDRALPTQQVIRSFDHAWLASIHDWIAPEDPEIGAFDGQRHLAAVDAYRVADRAHIETAAVRVKRAVAERATRARDEYPDEATLVTMQAARQRGHKPVRDMFEQAPHVIGALKPCWVMSPLVVSQLLPTSSGEPPFDVVIFDEASQITQPDAIPAILRGRRVVVAGDELQLPPTSFFAASDPQTDEDEEDAASNELSAVEGYESILQALDGLVTSRMLTWHYRSHDERLIAFSNMHLYDRSLTTFPGVTGEDCLAHEFVPFQVAEVDQTLSVAGEVGRVVDLILRHAEQRPAETLGVIAMGIKHANRIDEALRKARAERPDLEEFFAEDTAERFFVKNLERVQGDERDAIILTIGYGKDQNGRLPYRFGPLLYEGGHRRLNVAVTRARRSMTLVSSFTHTDMDPDRAKSDGVRLLREYLEYAASRGTNLGAVAREKPSLNPFEIDVRDQLTRAGIPVIAQHGCSGFLIDFAAKHHTRPGLLVLAIECDGASYHSSTTARDRDRLRQEQLERLGWRFLRIWSTDWFRNRDTEIARAALAYKQAVEDADEQAGQGALPPPKSPSSGGGAATAVKTSIEGIERSPRPRITTDVAVKPRGRYQQLTYRKRHLDEYSQAELVKLVDWIESDTRLRTEAEIVKLVLGELGFKQHRESFNAPVIAAIRRARSNRSADRPTD